MRHRRCDTALQVTYSTGGGAWRPPSCVMCGGPVIPAQNHCTWFAPSDPAANEHGFVYRHAQASNDDIAHFRCDRKWGRSRPAKTEKQA